MEYSFVRLNQLFFDERIITISPSVKLQADDIKDLGNTAVISQDQQFIMGYTDLVDNKLINGPFTVFGDHTEILKYVDFPFIQGADGIKILKADDKSIDSKFLYYALKNCYYPTGFYQRHYKLLKKTYIPDLDMQYQQRIASILSNYDQLIENNNRRIKILEDMAESLYKEWFVRFRFPGYETTEFENGIPKGWKISNLLQIINLNDSMRKPLSSLERNAMDKIYPYYGAAELLDKVDNFIFDGRYLLMGEDGSVITPDGYPVLQYVEGKFWVNNHAHVISGNNTCPLNFLYCLLKKMPIIDIVTGAAQPKISQGRMQKKKVVIPTDDLIKKFCTIVDDIFDDEFCLKVLNEKLVKQRDALLPRLMSGKLEVNIDNSNHSKESFGEVLTLSQYKQQLLQGMAARASGISDNDIKAAYEAYVNDRRKKD